VRFQVPGSSSRFIGSSFEVRTQNGNLNRNWNGELGTDDSLSSPRHLNSRAARERKQQDALRFCARKHEMSNAMRERVRFARSGTGNNQQRPGSELRGLLLFTVQ
jgi:hypothetical protein